MRRTPILVAATLVAALSLTACSQAEDAAKNAAGDAACSLAKNAADQAGKQAAQAVDDIGADPQAARQELSGIRDALAAAEKTVDGDVKADLTAARKAVEKLLGQAQDAAQGVEVDTTAVESAKDELDRAVDDVKTLC